jgi:hypothetical protein
MIILFKMASLHVSRYVLDCDVSISVSEAMFTNDDVIQNSFTAS